MTDDPNALITQLQRRSRRWRAAAILAFSGLFLVVLIQTVFIIDLRDQLENTHETAEWARKAATAARDDAGEARRVASESARRVQAEMNEKFVVEADKNEEFIRQSGSDTDGLFLFPTDQMYRDFDVNPYRR
jgi:hypothetical protein